MVATDVSECKRKLRTPSGLMKSMCHRMCLLACASNATRASRASEPHRWDPYENLPPEYARIFRFTNLRATRRRVLEKRTNLPVNVRAATI